MPQQQQQLSTRVSRRIAPNDASATQVMSTDDQERDDPHRYAYPEPDVLSAAQRRCTIPARATRESRHPQPSVRSVSQCDTRRTTSTQQQLRSTDEPPVRAVTPHARTLVKPTTFRPAPASSKHNHNSGQPSRPRPTTEALPSPSLVSRRSLLIGAGMALASGALLAGQMVPARIADAQQHYAYGTALVSRLRANVGHGADSEFTSFVSGKHIIIIEVVLMTPLQVHTYCLSIGYPDSSPHLVLLKTASVNPHGRPGYPDLLVQPQNLDGSFNVSYVLSNTGTSFQVS